MSHHDASSPPPTTAAGARIPEEGVPPPDAAAVSGGGTTPQRHPGISHCLCIRGCVIDRLNHNYIRGVGSRLGQESPNNTYGQAFFLGYNTPVIFIMAVYARTLTDYHKAKYLLPLAAYHVWLYSRI